jgi:Arc/MetJ-type ribon-helix-helix transcriptional regulator
MPNPLAEPKAGDGHVPPDLLFFKDTEEHSMTIKLPEELEQFIKDEVRNGRFASEQAALAEAVQLFRNQVGSRKEQTRETKEPAAAISFDPVLGAMRQAAEEIDEILALTMRYREQQPLRMTTRGEF